ncbi:MAG: MFS transporter [bacterium]
MRAFISERGFAALSRPGTLRLLLAAFLLDLLSVFVVFGYGSSYLLQDLHAPAAYPAYALAIYGAMKTATSQPAGWLLDRLGKGPVVAIAFAAGTTGLALAARVQGAPTFFVAVGLLAVSVSIGWIVVMGGLAQEADATHRGAAASTLGLLSGAATGSAIFLASAFIAIGTPHRALGLGVCLVIVVSALMAFATMRPPEPVHFGRKQVLRDRLPMFAIIFCHFAALSAVAGVYIPFLLRDLNLSTTQAALVLLPAAGAAGMTMLWSGSRSRAGGRFALAGDFYALGGLALLLTARESHILLVVLLTIPVVGALAATAPLVNAAVLDTGSRARGEALGWIFLVEGLGAAAGPLVAASAISLVGIRLAMVVLACLVIPFGLAVKKGQQAIRP